MNIHRLWVACCAVTIGATTFSAKAQWGGFKLTPPEHRRANCISAEEDAKARREIEQYQASAADRPALPSSTLRYPFFPQGGYTHGDLFTGLFVDLDPGDGILDYHCTDFTYNTHAGIDCGLRSFAEQAVGVPIFAALDGVVVATDDGHDDMHTQGENNDANFVILDHGQNRYAYYWHMRKNSVAVAAGEQVRAGQQIGLSGSSGYSFGPHLHFENRDLPNFSVVEPFAGDCRPGESGWVDQEPLRLDTYLIDFAFTYEDLFNHAPFPYEQPRTGQIAFTDTFIYFWFQCANLPAQTTWRNVFVRPNGTIYYDSGDQPFGNPSFYRYTSGFFYWYMEEMHSVAGTWRVRFYFDGQLLTDAPIEVVPERNPNFNRAPAPIAVHFEPSAPTQRDVIFCRVDTDLVLDDLDYDVVRYEYVWTIDGNEVRRVTSAGQGDAIPLGLTHAGSLVSCTVTPSDGKVGGSPASASVTVNADPCSGSESLKPKCRLKGTRFILKAKVSGGLPGESLTFRLDDDAGTDKVIGVNARGKAVAKFNDVAAGPHTVGVVECGLYDSATCD